MSKNRLSEETSEYLLQHKDNPVHWWAWGEEAFKEAKAEDKPILLSIGYAACHWCHVMAHECFEDEEVAKVMNELFINIKLDREERPDIDKIYMTSLHHLGEQGGWPLNMFLTPQGEPFWGGTYFPKIPKYGRPDFTTVLKTISEVYQNEPEKIKQNTESLKTRLEHRAQNSGNTQLDIPLKTILEKLMTIMDMEKGGPKGAPKFPQSSLLSLFWLGYQKYGQETYKQFVDISLKNMCQGGIYDHLGGGFSRYSVDESWLVPHFEKMIYDNAQLISLMSKAYLETGNDLFRIRIEETAGWLMRDMGAKDGAFYASLDADSEGVEGKYYVWDKEEIKALLPDDLFDSFVKIYGVDSNGNWEEKNILNRLTDLSLADDKIEESLKKARIILLSARDKRIKPGLDDKILADWNGLLICALCKSAVILENDAHLSCAKKAFAFITKTMRQDKKLAHSYAKGQVTQASMLDDYAFMIKAALSLFEITTNQTYLDQAEAWLSMLTDEFWDHEAGAYFLSSSKDKLLITRFLSTADDATPNGNAAMIENLTKLYSYKGNQHYLEKAETIIASLGLESAKNIFSHASFFAAKDFSENYAEIIIFPSSQNENPTALIAECLRISAPHKIIHLYTDQKPDKNHPAYGKRAINDRDTYYLCRHRTCSQPVFAVNELKTLLK